MPGFFPYRGTLPLNEGNNPGALPRIIVSSIQTLGNRIFFFKNADQFNKIPNNAFLLY
jgi:hypothetical protein